LTTTQRGIVISDTIGGKQELRTVSESGLYAIVLYWREAAEISLRAEWRLGEMLIAQKEAVGLSSTLVGK
jgi:hypothetical protein